MGVPRARGYHPRRRASDGCRCPQLDVVERVQHPRVRENFEYLDVAPVEDAILTLARWHDMVSAWDPRRVEAMRAPCQSEWVGIIRQIKARLRI